MIDNPFSLEGKRILVTGASSGIGKEIAVMVSRMGADVILSARNIERLEETRSLLKSGEHSIIRADVTATEDIENLVGSVGEINGAVLCAGMAINLPIQFCDRPHMDQLFDLNFFSTVELIRLLYKKKKILKGGSIVFVDSVGGLTRFAPGGAIYGATKAALSSYSKFCAREFSTRKIRVNCVCPGMIDTPLIHRGTLTEEQLAADAKRYPCGRYGKPEDVAAGVVYLLSDASSWVTGTNLYIDGGISII